ncbi:Nose resistant to fluoxetine protein 6 [Aphelenchoides bicaudatus]|nr:Nose resistant to fluoxetine protein 6 [Aphelenchoides bicaudatus]
MYVLLFLTVRLSVSHWHPMWPPTDPAVQCPTHWPTNILLMNSLVGNMCMPWTWYISCEFIFYLFAPLFLIGMHKNRKVCFFLSVSTILASSLANAWTMHVYNFPPTPLVFTWNVPALKPSSLFNPNFMEQHLIMYIKPWYRVGPYIVGLLLGYYLSELARMEKPPRRSSRFMAIGWLASFVGAFWALFGVWPATQVCNLQTTITQLIQFQAYNWPIYHYVYGALHRTVFAASFGFLIYACQTERAQILNSVLGSRLLLPLSSLSYSVYLVHLIAIAFTYMWEPFPMWFTSKWPLFGHCLIQLFISYLMAGRVTLVAELPVLHIERILKQWARQRNVDALNNNSANIKSVNVPQPI